MLVAALCFLLLWIGHKLEWYGRIGNTAAVGMIWTILGVVVLVFLVFCKFNY